MNIHIPLPLLRIILALWIAESILGIITCSGPLTTLMISSHALMIFVASFVLILTAGIKRTP